MVQLVRLDHLEYKEAILDSPEFRDKLRKHEKHIVDTSKNIKLLLKKLDDVISASEALRTAQNSFSLCLKDFQLGFVGDTNDEESDIGWWRRFLWKFVFTLCIYIYIQIMQFCLTFQVDTLESTYGLFQDIKEFSNKMINTGRTLMNQLENFRKDKFDTFKEKKKDYEKQTVRYCTTIEKYLQSAQYVKKEKNVSLTSGGVSGGGGSGGGGDADSFDSREVHLYIVDTILENCVRSLAFV